MKYLLTGIISFILLSLAAQADTQSSKPQPSIDSAQAFIKTLMLRGELRAWFGDSFISRFALSEKIPQLSVSFDHDECESLVAVKIQDNGKVENYRSKILWSNVAEVSARDSVDGQTPMPGGIILRGTFDVNSQTEHVINLSVESGSSQLRSRVINAMAFLQQQCDKTSGYAF